MFFFSFPSNTLKLHFRRSQHEKARLHWIPIKEHGQASETNRRNTDTIENDD